MPEPSTPDREASSTLAMQRIFDEFMFTLNADERRFVIDMLQLLHAEAVYPREGALSVHSSRRLREYLQDEMSISFLGGLPGPHGLPPRPAGPLQGPP